MRNLLYLLCVFVFSCTPTKKKYTAQEIVDLSIEETGVKKLNNADVSFDFRDMHYTANRSEGFYMLTRSLDSIKDELSNNKFRRYVNGQEVVLSDSLANLYSNSVNSVHYFATLPFSLNDEAVRKERLDDVIIFDEAYYQVKITFTQEGGGDDFEDVFLYWFHKETFLIDYMAYAYKTDGGGMRFRSVKDEMNVNGIRFRNYDNYKPTNPIDLYSIHEAYMDDKLTKVSEINLRNIQVRQN